MVPVGGKLWCGSQNRVLIINTTTLVQEVSLADLQMKSLTVNMKTNKSEGLTDHWCFCFLFSIGFRLALTTIAALHAWWCTVRVCGWRCKAVHRSGCTMLRLGRAWRKWMWHQLCTKCLQVSTHSFWAYTDGYCCTHWLTKGIHSPWAIWFLFVTV